MLGTLIFMILSVSSSSVQSATTGMTYIGCSSDEAKKLEAAYTIVYERNPLIQENLDKIYQALVNRFKAPGDKTNKNRFFRIAKCIGRKLSRHRFQTRCTNIEMCEPHLENSAYVDGDSKLMSHFFGNGYLNVCHGDLEDHEVGDIISRPVGPMKDKSIEISNDLVMAGKIYHEIAHLCWADDLGYFTELASKTLQRIRWSNNADTYDNVLVYIDQLIKLPKNL